MYGFGICAYREHSNVSCPCLGILYGIQVYEVWSERHHGGQLFFLCLAHHTSFSEMSMLLMSLDKDSRGFFKNWLCRTSLVVQWLGVQLPIQGAWVPSLVWEDPTCCRTAKPVSPSCWVWALEPLCRNYWSRHALEQEKPPQGKTSTLQLESSPHAAMKTQDCGKYTEK